MHSWIKRIIEAKFHNGLIAFLIILVFFVVYLAGKYSFLNITISNSQKSEFRVYWKFSNTDSLSEDQSAFVNVNNLKKNYWVILPVRLSDIDAIRLDPTNREGVESSIKSIRIFSLSTQPVVINQDQNFSKLQANNHVGELHVTQEGIRFKSIGPDPNFLYEIARSDSLKFLLARLLLGVILCFLILALFRYKSCFSIELRFVPYGMLLVSVLIIVMAAISKENSHPDEITHINNAVYYSEHWSPPVVCSPESRFTYSTYGVSRLDKREIYYYLTGKYLHLLTAIPTPTVIKLRSFNVVLFLILTALAFKYVPFRFIVLPILLTPQAWYIFSYFNSDALSLFVVFLASFQLFIPDSLLRKLLRREVIHAMKFKLILLSILVAMQFWVKVNFFFFAVFVALLLCSWVVINKSLPKFNPALPLIISLLCGVVLFSGWEFWRHSINNFEVAEKTLDCRERTAGPLYKPSTPLAETHVTFRLRDKGETLLDLVEKHNWLQRIFFTGLGAYGYLEFLNDTIHYKLASLFILIFVAYLTIEILMKGTIYDRITLPCAITAMLGLLFAAALSSWQSDLQAQGRYLLVYLPILGSVIILNRHLLNLNGLFIFSIIPFLLALFSFIFVGIMEIPKFQ